MKVSLVPIERLKPYPRNPRRNDAAVAAVVKSIQTYGFRQPIVTDEENVIIVGHTRWKAAQQLGLARVPVHIAEGLTEAQKRGYRLADNQTNTIAQWDEELLPLELHDLRDLGFDLSTLGFSEDQLEDLLAPPVNEGLCDPDNIPEVPKKPITKRGDVWTLGAHKLLCGDATSSDDVNRLLDGDKATMLWTDPPWNVAIGQDSNPRHRQREGLKNDNLSATDFRGLLDGFIANAKAVVNRDVYCVLGASEWPTLDLALRSAGYHWSATIIWAKDAFVLGRSKYHRRYEPIWFGWHEDGQSSFCDRRDLDDVWEIPRPRRSEEHPTMKPCELPARAIQYSSKRDDIVLDLFGGGGSTLIACEQHGRRARLMELDECYCDVIVRRWERFSGKKAELVANAS